MDKKRPNYLHKDRIDFSYPYFEQVPLSCIVGFISDRRSSVIILDPSSLRQGHPVMGIPSVESVVSPPKKEVDINEERVDVTFEWSQ